MSGVGHRCFVVAGADATPFDRLISWVDPDVDAAGKSSAGRHAELFNQNGPAKRGSEIDEVSGDGGPKGL